MPAAAPTPRDLDALPTKDGFRLRGLEMTRLETFTDAAFAFAVTLLVISVDAIPTDYDELVRAIKGVPAFGLSFVLLLQFWFAHWSWSRRFGLEDVPSMVLSWALIFVVLCYVYPLKFMFASMMHWISGGFLTAPQSSFTGASLYSTFAIYAAGFVAMCACIILLNVHALRQARALGLDRLERFVTRAEIGAWSIVGAVGVLSLLLALLTPPHRFGLPGWAYMLLPVVMPIYAIACTRANRRLLAEVGPERSRA